MRRVREFYDGTLSRLRQHLRLPASQLQLHAQCHERPGRHRGGGLLHTGEDQEVRILRFNPTPASPPFSYFSSLFTLSSSYSSGSSSLCSLCSSTSTGSLSFSYLSPWLCWCWIQVGKQHHREQIFKPESWSPIPKPKSKGLKLTLKSHGPPTILLTT